MTAQEVFDKVARHLRAQGKKAKLANGKCVYRTPDGLKCAVGCLIEDDEYSPILETMTVSVLARGGSRDTLAARLSPHIALLEDLQKVHDLYSEKEWDSQLSITATSFGLAMPSRECAP